MRLHEQEIRVGPAAGDGNLIEHFRDAVAEHLPAGDVPVRFVVTAGDDGGADCELGALTDLEPADRERLSSIFEFAPRGPASTETFNAVLLVPTGIGAAVGGHAGDAGPTARLLAGTCDTLITHPNVVNASDINELPDNGLYVEGSVITRMLMGTAALQPVRANRVLVVIDEHAEPEIAELTINAASAARTTLGMDCAGVVRMDPPIQVHTDFSSSGSAVGRVEHLERLCEVLASRRGSYDAVALGTLIVVPEGTHEEYFASDGEGVNPWGGVEAMLTHAVSMLFDVPSAHAPMMESLEMMARTFGIVDSRMAAEEVSRCFIHCVFKGLHRSPRIVTDREVFGARGLLRAEDVDCLVIPDGCVGLPTLAALYQNIPVIAVRENRNRMRNDLSRLPLAPGQLHFVDNYLEAAGLIMAMRAGICPASVRRPLESTPVEIVQTESPVVEAK